MPVFKGNTSTTATQGSPSLSNGLMSFSLVNKAASPATVNVYIKDAEDVELSIIPKDLVLAVGDTLYSDMSVKILKGNYIHLTTTAEIDYYFTIE